MLNESDNYIGSLHESYLGRPTLNCRTLLYDSANCILPSISDSGSGATESAVEQAAGAADVTGDPTALAPC